MKTDWIRTRQTRFTAYVTVYVLIVLAAIVLANWLADRYNKTVDTTSNKRFSLSDQTVKVVKGLQQPVTLTYWDRRTSFSAAKDLLGRYETLSPKLKVNYVDPVAKPQEARSANVREIGLLRVDAGGRIQEARSLSEEEVTGAIMRALKGAERTVCVATGSGEGSLADAGREGYSTLKTLIERETYKTRDLSLVSKPEIASDCTVTAIIRPRFDYQQPIIDAIKKYVEGGGRLLVLTGAPIESGEQPVSDNKTLLALVKGWGISAQDDIILEASANAQVLGPEVPLVSDYSSHPIVRDLRGVFTGMPIARALEVKGEGSSQAERLFSSSDASLEGQITGKKVSVDPAKSKKGPFVLGAAATIKNGKQEGRVVVVGSSDWVTNAFLRFNGNASLIMNSLNWLSSDEDLISIRPKDPEDRRLNMSQGQLRTVLYVSLFLLPMLSIVGAISVWWQRR